MKSIKSKLKRIYVERKIRQERRFESNLVLKNVIRGGSSLTDSEKQAVKDLWGDIAVPLGWGEYELFKRLHGFDPRYLSHEIYLPLVARRLNNYHYTKFFEHKSLLGVLGVGGMRFPYCYVRCVDGEFYDNSMQQLSPQRAMEICLAQDVLVWKPSCGSSGGRGIEKVELAGQDEATRRQTIERLLTTPVRDFVVQRCIEQHASMSRFCSTSVNTFRIYTLYLNGRATCENLILRIGNEGSFFDNFVAGGVMIKIFPDGRMSDYGYRRDCSPQEEFNGVTFKGQRIDIVPSLIEAVLAEHKRRFPLCKFIGWDVCVDSEGSPVVIEINSSQPGCSGEQICGGPIFGERTQEVIDYIRPKKFNYNRQIIQY